MLRGIPENRVEELRAIVRKTFAAFFTACIFVIPSYFKVWNKGVTGIFVFLITSAIGMTLIALIIWWTIKASRIFFKLIDEVKILEYKTCNDTTITGKQYVLFCSAAKDEELYYEDLSEEIFQNHKSIVIWKIKDSKVPLSKNEKIEVSFEISSINLLFFPVTREFLYTENDARCVILPMALENHIPILPFVMEEGIEAEFNRICGNLQLLSQDNRDITAVSYEDKLNKFLDSVLFSDSIMERIRQAFDAYVFISYRKKDRRYANEIMNLIHKNPFCRDIAIWYDEYLVPGENFDDAIREACRKSELFTMVVTPNVLDNPNYVKDYEYPFAQRENITILPIMMEATDPENLKTKYPEIPKCVTPGNALDDALNEFAKELYDKEKYENPEHMFFIGLAYLNGIDVEKNSDIAVEMMTRAAEGGVIEAYEKIVDMYYHGYGVERNYRESIAWEDRYCNFLLARANENKDDEARSLALRKKIFTFYLKAMLYDTTTMDEDIYFIEGIKSEFYRDDESFDKYLKMMWAMYNITRGDYAKLLHNDSQSEWYEKTYSYLEKLDNSDDPELYHFYMLYIGELGPKFLCEDSYNLEKAEQCIKKSLEASTLLIEKYGDNSEYYDAAFYTQHICYRNLASIYMTKNEIENAKEYLSKSQKILEDKRFEFDPDSKVDLGVDKLLLGICIADDDPSASIILLNEAQDILEGAESKLYGTDNTLVDRDRHYYYLTLVYLEMGILGDEEKKETARKRIQHKLEEKPDNELYRNLLNIGGWD